VLAILIALGFSAGTADAQTMTLEAAIRGALRNDNIDLQLQNETVNGAAGRLKQAAGAFDWNVNAQAGYQTLYVGKVTSTGALTNQVSQVGSYYYSVGVGKEFRNGISIAPGFIGYPGAGASPAQTGGLTQARPLLGLKIPLLRGLGEESADAGERAARDALFGAKLGRTFAIAQIVENVAQTYWRCIADDRIAQLSQTTDQAASDYQATLDKMVKQGLVEPGSAKQNSINGLGTQMNTIAAIDVAQKCHRDLGYSTTGKIGGPQPALSGDLPAVAPMIDAVNHLSAPKFEQLAFDNRPDLQAAQKNVDATAETLKSARDSTSPDLSLRIDPDHATLNYTQSLGNNYAEGQEEAAEAANNQAQLALRELQDKIRFDINDAIHGVQEAASAWTKLNAAKSQMEKIVSDGKRSAQFGAIGWQQYISSQGQLLQLQQQLINAQLQFAIGLAGLRLATGSIEMDSETPASIAAKLASLPS
jgi:outer membrane protein TolC